MKVCSKCGAEEAADVTFPHKRRCVCRACINAENRAKYAANPEKYRAKRRNWIPTNPEKIKADHDAWLLANAEKIKADRKAAYDADPEFWKAKTATWRADNPEKAKESSRKSGEKRKDKKKITHLIWLDLNSDRVRETGISWRTNNAERLKEIKSAWVKANPESNRAYAARRRALAFGAGGTYTKNDIEFLMGIQKNKCAHAWCRKSIKKKYHIDHIIPLSRGGSNDRKNLQILCVKCNLSKHTTHPIVFAQRHGMLL